MGDSERPERLGCAARLHVTADMGKDGSDCSLRHPVESMYFRWAFCLVNAVVSEKVSEFMLGEFSSAISVKSTNALGG